MLDSNSLVCMIKPISVMYFVAVFSDVLILSILPNASKKFTVFNTALFANAVIYIGGMLISSDLFTFSFFNNHYYILLFCIVAIKTFIYSKMVFKNSVRDIALVVLFSVLACNLLVYRIINFMAMFDQCS